MFHNIIKKKFIYRSRPSCALYFTSLYLLSVHGYTKNSSALFLLWFSYIVLYTFRFVVVYMKMDRQFLLYMLTAMRPPANQSHPRVWDMTFATFSLSRFYLKAWLVIFFLYYNKKKVKSTFSCNIKTTKKKLHPFSQQFIKITSNFVVYFL